MDAVTAQSDRRCRPMHGARPSDINCHQYHHCHCRSRVAVLHILEDLDWISEL